MSAADWLTPLLSLTCLILAAAFAKAIGISRSLRRKNDQLSSQNAALESKSLSSVRLLAAACHDLKQPAHALGLLMEVGSDLERDPQRIDSWIGQVKRCASSLSEMLSALMDVGRLDGSTEPPTLVAVSVAELQSEVLLHFEEAARLKGLELEVQPVDLHVLSDRHLLRRILFNLVANAVKYTEFGCVAVTATARGEEVVIRVDDNGPGIPKAKLEDAFVEYVRLDPSHSSDGLGIGLATVRRAAALLSHPLKIVSSPGLGTMVTLRLPLHQPAQNGIESRTNQGSVDADGLVVGLIEDDVLVRAAMEELLVRWGCRPVAAASAEELLNALPLIQASVDLLIADYHLQGSNGLQAIQDVRAALGTETLPAILITGDVDDSISTEAGRKLVRLEHKPLLPARLAALVRQYGVAA